MVAESAAVAAGAAAKTADFAETAAVGEAPMELGPRSQSQSLKGRKIQNFSCVKAHGLFHIPQSKYLLDGCC